MITRIVTIKICALLITPLFASTAAAATLSFTESYAESGGAVFGPFDAVFLTGFGTPLDALPQFDPSIGALMSATLSYGGNLTVAVSLSAGPQSDPELSSYALADYYGGVGLIVPIDGTSTLEAERYLSDFVDCSAAAGIEVCDMDASIDNFTFESVMFTGAAMGGFIGTGTLEEFRLELLAGLVLNMGLINFDDAFLEINVDFIGDVTVEYEYAPVPLPGAVWLLGTSVVGLSVHRRRVVQARTG